MRLSRNYAYGLLILLVLFACYIRVNVASGFQFNADEAMHFSISKGNTLGDVWSNSTYETHPPLTYFLYHYWIKLGESADCVRLLPLFAGLALIVLYFFIGVFIRDEVTGLCLAALITFSQGCIIQSFLIRQYAFCMLFLSLGYYVFLQWRQRRTDMLLAGYGLCIYLACASHFSALLAVFCIASVESVSLLHRQGFSKTFFKWAAVNSTAAFLVVFLYLSLDTTAHSISFVHPAFSWRDILSQWLQAPVYPFLAIAYVFPNFAAGLLGGYFLPILWKKAGAGLKNYLPFTWVAFALGGLLVAGNFYPLSGTRHGFWVLPFVIVPAGIILAELLRWISSDNTRINIKWLLLAMPVVLWAVSDYPQRFTSPQEYQLEMPTWSKMEDSIASLDQTAVIYSERGDNTMFDITGDYFYQALRAQDKADLTVHHPFMKTSVIVRRAYGDYTGDVFIRALKEAQKKGLFEGKKTIEFFLSRGSLSPARKLLQCDEMHPGTITRFQNSTGRGVWVDMFSVSTQDVIEKLLPQQGSARHCLFP